MDRLWIGIGILCVCLVGLVRLLRDRKAITQRKKLATEFSENLHQYVESNGRNAEAYGWMIHRSNRMQNELGTAGIFAVYRPPYANYQYKNYPVILNMLPDLQRSLSDSTLSRGDLPQQYASAIQHALVRHLGSLDDLSETISRALKNPFFWLREGVRTLLSTPLALLEWAGIISGSWLSQITSNYLFKALSGISALIGLFSALMGILLGWDQFVTLVKAWWSQVFPH